MSPRVITAPAQVNTGWLTSCLAGSGALTFRTVSSVEIDAGSGNYSTNPTLLVRYTDNAQGSRPQRLFLKTVDTRFGNGDDFDDKSRTTRAITPVLKTRAS